MDIRVLGCLALIWSALPARSADVSCVSNGRELIEAIRRSSPGIVLSGDVEVAGDGWPAGGPYRLQHNISITSGAGGPYVLDLSATDVNNKLLINAGTQLTLGHLVLKSRHYSADSYLDILAPSPGGLLYMHDLSLVRASCPRPKADMLVSKSPAFPGAKMMPLPHSMTWNGTSMALAVHYVDFATLVPPAAAKGQGLLVRKQNTYELCAKLVDKACEAQTGAAACLKQEAAPSSQHSQQQLSPSATAGIAAAGAVGGTLLLLTASVLCLRMHRSRQLQQQQQQASRQHGQQHEQQQQQLLPVGSHPCSSSRGRSSSGSNPAIANGAGPAAHGCSAGDQVQLTLPMSLALFGPGSTQAAGSPLCTGIGSAASSYSDSVSSIAINLGIAAAGGASPTGSTAYGRTAQPGRPPVAAGADARSAPGEGSYEARLLCSISPTTPRTPGGPDAAQVSLSGAPAAGGLLLGADSSTSSSCSLGLSRAHAVACHIASSNASDLPPVVMGTLPRELAAIIQFGPLVASDALSRVFRARFCDQDVAVKVISHSSTSVQQVSNTMRQFLSLQHTNVLKPLAFVTFAAPCAPERPCPLHGGCLNPYKDSAHYMPMPKGSSPSCCCRAAPADESRRHYSAHEGEFACDQARSDFVRHSPASPACSPDGPEASLAASLTSKGQLRNCSMQCSPSGAACSDAVSSAAAALEGCCIGSPTAATGDSAASDQLETWVIASYCYGGSLQRAVQEGSVQGFFEEGIPQMRPILEQLLGVARGMEYLHDSNWVVGDLTAANILLDLSAPAAGTPSVSASCLDMSGGSDQQHADFQHGGLLRAPSRQGSCPLAPRLDGSSCEDSAATVTVRKVPRIAGLGIGRCGVEGVAHLSTHLLCATTHQAPEVMRSGKLSKPADVFAFGVLMWEVIMAAAPWRGKCMADIINLVLVEQARPAFAPYVPKGYAYVAASCWQESPRDRPSFAQLALLLERLRDEADSLQLEANSACGKVTGYFSTC